MRINFYYSKKRKAIGYLQRANYAGYFEYMSKKVLEEHKSLLSELKLKFASSNTNQRLSQELEVFAQKVFDDKNEILVSKLENIRDAIWGGIMGIGIILSMIVFTFILTKECSKSSYNYDEIQIKSVIMGEGGSIPDLRLALKGDTGKFSGYSHSWSMRKSSISIGDTLSFSVCLNNKEIDVYKKKVESYSDLEYITIRLEDADKSLIQKMQGFDTQGHKVEYELTIIDQSHYWIVDSINTVYMNGKKSNVCEFIQQNYKGRRYDWETNKGIICVGNACEEPYNPQHYTNLAQARATYLAICPFFRGKKVYTLNLGQHKKTGATNYDAQRTVIIIGILYADPQADINEALYSAWRNLENRENMPLNINNFSNVDVFNRKFNEFKLFRE